MLVAARRVFFFVVDNVRRPLVLYSGPQIAMAPAARRRRRRPLTERPIISIDLALEQRRRHADRSRPVDDDQ